ncbi:MAG: glycosyltransferase [Lachnospiraceae bacterium]
MRKIDDEIQTLLKEYQGDVRQILTDNHRLDYLYALSGQREMLLEWYEFDPKAALLQVGADYGAMTGLYSETVRTVTVLDGDQNALDTAALRHSDKENIAYVKDSLVRFAADPGSPGFDYVVIAGMLKAPYEENIRAAKALLKPDGVLIVAAANPLGMKYLAGTEKEPDGLSKQTLVKLLGDDSRFYYPMPDYRTPVSIYSDEYPPGKGDMTRVVPAYDYPRFHLMDMGESFDTVCEDGLFEWYANSYLVFWSPRREKLRPEEDRIFIKYNKTRNESFQIKTCICENRNRQERYVEKAALSLDGMGHIWSFEEKYRMLEQQHRTLHVAEPVFRKDQNAVVFPYLEGETWAQQLGEKLGSGEPLVETMSQALDQIFDIHPQFSSSFEPTQEFEEVFGEGLAEADMAVLAEDTACAASNIDALFENILLTGEGIFCLDYEWVFLFPVPEHYVRYRILYYFYEQYSSLMNGMKRDSFLAAFGITPQMEEVYSRMEESFQNYVHGENRRIYLGNYMVYSQDLRAILQMESDLSRARERIVQLKAHIGEKDVTIRKITEVQRLTNNHVTNLETMIADLRNEIHEMGKTLTYLNDHEAVLSKYRRKLGESYNQKYPKGSLERKKLDYKKEYLMHPLRSMNYYATEEGKNMRAGDFDIGESYRQHGKLRFDKAENPKVSVIIPVYNQIHYTYACLVSILEHTKDVSYEVIIADDVSSDATEHLSDYTEGLVICRNSSNQGFLRNCNNAARHAKGEYVMFLNNDTQVTEGWLSALVNLIEADPTIGMAGSKLVYPDGRLQEAGGILWSDGSGWNYGRLDDPDKPEYNYVKDVDYISGAAILLSTRLWRQIGGFDTRFAPAYCEDSDLAFEVRKAGYRVVYQPLSKVIHFEGVSNGTDVEGSGLKRYQVVNSKKLKEKWAAEFAKQAENNGNPDPFRARERSLGKKIILVVDHYVPTFDKDAGSKTTFQYLKMFLKKGYVVKFLGDNFMHEEPYTTILQQMGIEVLYGSEYQVGIWDWLRDHGDDLAVAYLNRPHIASKYIDYILDHTDTKVIYYGHDLHFLRENREYQLTGEPAKREDAEYWKSIELTLMSKAAISYYPSYIEKEAIQSIDPTINVKDITAYVYESFKTDIQKDFSKREGLLFVGGFAHPPNADAVLWFARDIYPHIRTALGTDAPNFYIVGSKVTEEIQELEQPGNGIIVKGFVSEEELEHLYNTCKVVVVPLRYGAGVKGKVVEAIYYGSPIVTTSIGAEGIPGIEDILLIADEAQTFAQSVANLYINDTGCTDLCEKTQDHIRNHFSIDAAWSVIEEDF